MVLANIFVEIASRGACERAFFIRTHQAQLERSRICRLDKWSVQLARQLKMYEITKCSGYVEIGLSSPQEPVG
jgi:hypothetical protein